MVMVRAVLLEDPKVESARDSIAIVGSCSAMDPRSPQTASEEDAQKATQIILLNMKRLNNLVVLFSPNHSKDNDPDFVIDLDFNGNAKIRHSSASSTSWDDFKIPVLFQICNYAGWMDVPVFVMLRTGVNVMAAVPFEILCTDTVEEIPTTFTSTSDGIIETEAHVLIESIAEVGRIHDCYVLVDSTGTISVVSVSCVELKHLHESLDETVLRDNVLVVLPGEDGDIASQTFSLIPKLSLCHCDASDSTLTLL